MNFVKLIFFVVIYIMNAQVCASKELDKALQKALLTDNNLDTLQSIFYPTRKPQDAYVEIQINYEVKNITSSCSSSSDSDCSFSYEYSCNCYKRTDVVAITSPVNNDQALFFYVSNFFWIIRSVDVTFFSLLNRFIVDEYLNFVDYSDLNTYWPKITLEINYLSTNPIRKDLHYAAEILFSWVR